MRLPKQILILLVLFSSVKGYSQECIIYGASSSYSGQRVPLFTVENPISGSQRLLDSVAFNEKGDFELHLYLSEITVLYFKLGIYEGFLYAEPGHQYELSLPPYIQIKHADKISPFYSPVKVQMKVLSSKNITSDIYLPDEYEINNMLACFDSLFSAANELVIQYRQARSDINTDSLINELEQHYGNNNSPLFERYRKYRYGLLKINGGKTELEYLANNFLNDRTPRLNEPAYRDLFNAIFDDFLIYYSRTNQGSNIANTINGNQGLNALRHEVSKHPAIFSDTVADLVILKEIYQQYYNNYFIKEALLIIIDSLRSDAIMPDYKQFANDIFDRLSGLMIGNKPPDFTLRDQFGNYQSPERFKGKYTYLYFCTPDNYSCMMEYPYLNSLHKKHNEYLEIITIMVAKNREDMVQFMQQNKYDWTALYYGDQPGILQSYNIKYFPTSFLIGPDGTLIQSPATLPSEGFQQQLFRIMRSREDI